MTDTRSSASRPGDEPVRVVVGLVCALPEELGSLRERRVASRTVHGIEILELDLGGATALATVSGIGKVAAARAAALVVASGARRALFVVGTCGGLSRGLATGDLVHCRRAAQSDSSARDGRAVDADLALRDAWRSVAPGPEGWFLTADRPVDDPWRRWRLTRRFDGASVADMETAAVADVARGAGVPWAALRAVTDRAGWGTRASFRRHYPTQSGRAADTIPALVRRILLEPGPGFGPIGGAK